MLHVNFNRENTIFSISPQGSKGRCSVTTEWTEEVGGPHTQKIILCYVSNELTKKARIKNLSQKIIKTLLSNKQLLLPASHSIYTYDKGEYALSP